MYYYSSNENHNIKKIDLVGDFKCTCLDLRSLRREQERAVLLNIPSSNL